FEGALRRVGQHSGPTLNIYLFGHARLYIDQARVGILERGNRRSEIIQLLALHRAGLSGPQLASLLKMVNQQYEDDRLDPHYVRTLIWSTRNDARKQTGWDGIIQSPVSAGRGAHHYHLPNDTRCDLWEFEDKLDRADQLVARAVALANRAYGGSPTDRAGRECRAGGRMRGVLPGGYGDIGDAEPVGSVRDIVDTGDASGPAPLGKGRENARVEAAMLREEALELYRGEFCADSTLGCLVDAARALEERYLRSALQQADFWRTVALGQAPRPLASHRAAPRGAALHVEQRGRYALSASDRAVELGQPSRQAPMQTEWDARAVWREAQRNYERVLMTDPYHEVACIHCMQCCAALGDARGVGITFERYRDVLHEDLSQAPSMRVERAYQEFAP
ncbi:MAG TPA: bacterial transcriptional activator domain-containing protein, partial [Chloroflexia bacterium]|nr:bacterial transcriptional activator domain-containing protein [Chloroflexia bacterium]